MPGGALTAHREPADATQEAGPGEEREPGCGGVTDHTHPASLHPGHHAVRHLPAVQLDLHHDVAHVDQLRPVQLEDGERGGPEVVVLEPCQADVRDPGREPDWSQSVPLPLLLLFLAIFA